MRGGAQSNAFPPSRVNRLPAVSKESSDPEPLSDEGWAELVRPLRQYASAGSASTWKHDFRRQVDKAVALFLDRVAPAEGVEEPMTC